MEFQSSRKCISYNSHYSLIIAIIALIALIMIRNGFEHWHMLYFPLPYLDSIWGYICTYLIV